MQRQKISGVVRLEADGRFERRDNQARNNHIGQIVVQALEALHLLHYSSRRGSMSICSSVRSLITESLVQPATQSRTRQETCLRRPLILKIYKSGGFCLLGSGVWVLPFLVKKLCS